MRRGPALHRPMRKNSECWYSKRQRYQHIQGDKSYHRDVRTSYVLWNGYAQPVAEPHDDRADEHEDRDCDCDIDNAENETSEAHLLSYP